MRMYPISSIHTTPMQSALQKFHDCYLMASLGALSRSTQGRRVLEKNISHNQNSFNVKFQNVNGKPEDYLVLKSDIKKLLFRRKDGVYEHLDKVSCPVTSAVELAMNKLLGKHPTKKPLICSLMKCQQEFEYNRPSKFLNMFTGKKPMVLNESGIRMSLFSKLKKSMQLLKDISKDSGAVFVAGTGWNTWGKLPSWHCYAVKKVDIARNKIILFDHRKQAEIVLPIQSALHELKFLTGYFSKDLAQNV